DLSDGIPPHASQVMLTGAEQLGSAGGSPADAAHRPTIVALTTLCVLDAKQFVAAPGPRGAAFASSVRELKLKPEDTPFELSEVEALGAAIRFDALGQNIARALNAGMPGGATIGLPALRTGGISLFRSEPDDHVANVQSQVDKLVKLHQAKVQPAQDAAP